MFTLVEPYHPFDYTVFIRSTKGSTDDVYTHTHARARWFYARRTVREIGGERLSKQDDEGEAFYCGGGGARGRSVSVPCLTEINKAGGVVRVRNSADPREI